MAEIKPDSGKLSTLMGEIESGVMKIPAFQREFVWPMGLTLKLLDSIARGYPIGTLLFWETDQRLGSMRNIGGATLQDVPDGRLVRYVLDGQQRLTSLFAAVNAVTVGSRSYEILADLDATEESDDIFLPASAPAESGPDEEEDDGNDEAAELAELNGGGEAPVPGRDEHRFVTVADLLSENPVPLTRRLTDPRARRFGELRDSFNQYPFSLVTVKNADLNTVCEIFERVNNLGQRLDVFDLAVANTWSDEFDLRKRWREFHSKLVDQKFDDPIPAKGSSRRTIVRGIVGLQAVAAILRRNTKRDAILSIGREEMAAQWDRCTKCIELAADFVRLSLRVPAARLLPYPAVLAPLTYFYDRNGRRNPNKQQKERLRHYFWRIGVTRRYSYALDSMLLEDLGLMDAILQGEPHGLEACPEVTRQDVAQQDFRMSNTFCRTILAAVAAGTPLDLETADPVAIANSHIAQANSRNYHHAFPSVWLRANHRQNYAANMLFCRFESNVRIGGKPPSVYLPKLRAQHGDNPDRALRSQLASARAVRLMERDHYGRFLAARAQTIARRLSKLAGAAPTRDAD
ncbi:MAG TPA: DUF262 domain-containing protein [Anaerolineae bacterium]|nr:DUF262 domain-containing protein [Anaerolineae bacterium]